MKKHDDIKKGLEYLSIKDTVKKLDMWKEGIAYDYVEDAALDALSLIQHLEAHNTELLEKTKQLERERDAAVFDIKKFGRSLSRCSICSKSEDEERCSHGLGFCFEWRGLCEENGGKVNE
jgi:hypothetical protein